ncbi:MAG: hypothetical protein RL038_1060 [Actinomycetota bacterium]
MFNVIKTKDGANSLSTRDHGFTVGDGVFETIQTSAKGFLSLSRHLSRLERSAAIVKMSRPEIELIISLLEELRQDARFVGHEFGRLRITWTTGESELGSLRSGNWTVAIDWQEMKPQPATARIKISEYQKFSKSSVSGAKTTSYMENVIALNEVKALGFDEAILLNESGFIAEGTSSNIFIVKDAQVFTPNLASGALAGISRELLLENSPEIQEVELRAEDLMDADAVFLTSTTRDVQPVIQIGDLALAADHPNVMELAQRYRFAKLKEWQ